MINLMPYAVGWGVLTLVVIVLAVYRKTLAGHEDDAIHFSDDAREAAALSQQAALARKLEGIDRWGKLLTVVVVLYALGLLAGFLYNAWNQTW